MSTEGSRGSPLFRAAIFSTNRFSKASATSRWTMKRLAAMQDWPLLIVRALTAVDAAASRSALGMTMNGSLPPSSSTHFLIWAPAARPTETPAPSLPVRVTAAMRGSSISRATRSDPTSSAWKAPSGNPAPRKISSIASAQSGTFEACLRSPTLPAIRAGAAKRKTCQNGKFQGITARTGPSGS